VSLLEIDVGVFFHPGFPSCDPTNSIKGIIIIIIIIIITYNSRHNTTTKNLLWPKKFSTSNHSV